MRYPTSGILHIRGNPTIRISPDLPPFPYGISPALLTSYWGTLQPLPAPLSLLPQMLTLLLFLLMLVIFTYALRRMH